MNLASINPEFRKVAMSELARVVPSVDPRHFNKLSTGLFYFFWFSDGVKRQAADRDSIVSLVGRVEQSLRFKWVQVLLSTTMELWQTMDKQRQDKYLSLLKELAIGVYSGLGDDWPAAFGRWNHFLSTAVIHDDKRGLKRPCFRVGVAVRDSGNPQALRFDRGEQDLHIAEASVRRFVKSCWRFPNENRLPKWSPRT